MIEVPHNPKGKQEHVQNVNTHTHTHTHCFFSLEPTLKYSCENTLGRGGNSDQEMVTIERT